jgi:hypothetical protein
MHMWRSKERGGWATLWTASSKGRSRRGAPVLLRGTVLFADPR